MNDFIHDFLIIIDFVSFIPCTRDECQTFFDEWVENGEKVALSSLFGLLGYCYSNELARYLLVPNNCVINLIDEILILAAFLTYLAFYNRTEREDFPNHKMYDSNGTQLLIQNMYTSNKSKPLTSCALSNNLLSLLSLVSQRLEYPRPIIGIVSTVSLTPSMKDRYR